MIAVVMAAPDFKTRFREAAELLNMGFATTSLYEDPLSDVAPVQVPVTGSIEKTVKGDFKGPFTYLCMNGENPSEITREICLETSIEAPVQAGDPLGKLLYSLNGQEIGSIPVTAAKDVPRAAYMDYLWMVMRRTAVL